MTLGIVKRDEFEFNQWIKRQSARAAALLERWGLNPQELLSTEIGWLLVVGKYEGRRLDFDPFQFAWLTNRSHKRSINKSRQVGFSFAIGCESVSRCHLKDKHTAVCVSYNLADAKEKIARVKEIHDELPLEFQKKIITDTKTEVVFQSNSHKRRVSRVISHPARPPRGKTGDIYLDELAHCQNDHAIYVGSTALISRSKGQLTVGSTPLGKRGTFYDIHTQEINKYPGFWRQDVPWWLCRHFCKDVVTASALAPSLPTEVRVERYGTAALREQFDSLPLEDFQQEFELAFQDERVAYFPYELILPCCQKEAHDIPVYSSIEVLANMAPKMSPLYAGFDVGRKKHPSELTIFEKRGQTFILRYVEQFRDVPFPKQRATLKQRIRALGEHLRRFRIDDTGLGKNLGEDLVMTFGRKIEPVTFTNAIKEELANNMKIILQERNIVLPRDRGIIAQIHSIKQKFSASGRSIFDAEKARTHHADKFWSIALACRTKRQRKKALIVVGARTLGEDKKPEVVQQEKEDHAHSLVQKLFDVPTEQPARSSAIAVATSSEQVLLSLSPAQLIERGKLLARASDAWKASGDEEKAASLAREYALVRREFRRRKAVRALTER